jgi:hypothetical protein
MAVEVKEEKGEIQFFGEVDKHPKGGYSSEFPAWYFPKAIDDLKEDIRQKEDAADDPGIAKGVRQRIKQEVMEMKDRLRLIQDSKPKLSAKQTDELAGRVKELGERIGDSMFTHTDMKKGLAPAEEELKRMTEPCIKVDADLAKAAGVSLHKGLVTRDGAAKIWKIGRRALGEMSNVEALRKDRLDGYVA